jgi:hypothetical protein
VISYPVRITDQQVNLKLREIIDASNTNESAIETNASVIAAIAPPLTLAQIKAELQLGGGSALNITGLIGAVGLNVNATLIPGAIVIGQSTSQVESGSLGTIHTVLHGNSIGAPTFSAVVLTTDVSGVLPAANGGVPTGVAGEVLGGATPSFVKVTSAYVDNSIALTGVDINTSDQVTATHLAAPLPVAQGGTNVSAPTGGYIPALTNVANLTSSVSSGCGWMRIDNRVIVQGMVTVVPTVLGTYTELGIALPVPSNFGNSAQCGGTASSLSAAGPNQGALIGADVTNKRAALAFGATDTGSQDMWFIFMYQVIP